MRQNLFGSEIVGSLLKSGNTVGTLTQTLGATFVVDADMPNFIVLDPGGAGRDVTLPAEAAGLFFVIANAADAAEALTIKNDAGGTELSCGQSEVAVIFCDGTNWYGFVGVA